DCPFLTPHPVRGKIERNEPLLTAFVAKRLAQLRDASTAEIARMTAENARRLFQLPELPDKPSEMPNDEES
ncbi:MAG: TatD family hydrolase, partial [Thermoguttaceae bacterium]|nr:TatD family hydrolase [Thermoguttaceae bacterium]